MNVFQPLKFSVALSLLLTQAAIAQDLRLFEEPDRDPAQAAPAPEQNFMAPGNGQPAYTLRSLSRFGNQYQAVFVDRSGQTVKAAWNEGEAAAIPNSGFTVVATGTTSVSLMHPAGDSCVSAETVGVSCSAANRSELRLALAAPLANNGAQALFGPSQGNPGFVSNGANAAAMGPQPYNRDNVVGVYPPGFTPDAAAPPGQQVFINPFSGQPEVMPQVSPEELAARQQRQDVRAARLRQFEQRRIEDADIPPGMQRVRTPFGGQLMPIRE